MSTLRASFYEDLQKFQEIAEYTLLHTRSETTEKAALAVGSFFEKISGAPRGEGVIALLTLIRFFVQDWRVDEKILSGPVQ